MHLRLLSAFVVDDYTALPQEDEVCIGVVVAAIALAIESRLGGK